MSSMFEDCHNLISVDLSGINASPTTMGSMFRNCYSLEYINIDNLFTDKALYPSYMFDNCHSLKSLNLQKATFIHAKTLTCLFRNCYSLTSVNLANFDTAEVIDLSHMFENCYELTSLDLNHIITEYTTDMSFMFHNCSGLTSLLVKFNTYKVKYMQNMFSSCVNLATLNIGSFFTANVQNYTDMFKDDVGLELYFDFKTCANLKINLPDYVTPVNIN